MVCKKEISRVARHKRLRVRIKGTAQCPRLVVHRSLKNMHLQLIDDINSKTILFKATIAKDFKSKIPYGGNIKAATLLGELFAKEAKEKGLKKVIFDRGGYLYHGRIKAIAEGLRKGGLEF